MQQGLFRAGNLLEVSAGGQGIPGPNKYCYKMYSWSWKRVSGSPALLCQDTIHPFPNPN